MQRFGISLGVRYFQVYSFLDWSSLYIRRFSQAVTTKKNGQHDNTTHRLIQGDARRLPFIKDESVHLVVTSPPYWTLKRYNENPDQLGHVDDYETFLLELTQVWKELYRILVPGGRLVCVVGDVCLSRREYGRHIVVPLHADIAVVCR